MSQVTQILCQIEKGDGAAAEELLPLVYEELRRLAAAKLTNERSGHSIDATGLVHEAYLHLVGNDQNGPSWEGRRHFFAAAAEAMRRILVEQARRKSRQRHGGDQRRTATPAEDIQSNIDDPAGMLDLDQALTELEALDETMANVVKLRYFAGLTVDETAQVLELAPRTIVRQWALAKAWLRREILGPGQPE